MSTLRSLGFLFIGGSLVCFLIAWDHYRSKWVSAEAVAERLGIDLISVTPPTSTYVAAVLGVLLLSTGMTCMFEWRRRKSLTGNLPTPE